MSGGLIALIVVAVIVLVAVFWYVSTRNGIIDQRNRVDESWSGIDVQLKRRHDLVPNLVETVKGYASHEQQVFENVTKARSDAMAAQSVDETAKTESQLTRAMADLRAVAENYPDLKATENFQQLSRNLSELEDEVQASRRIYNSNVQNYNTKIQQFPAAIVAKQGNFTDKEFFEIADPAERETPSVSF
ncbi:MAG: LemA family protein [Solirubrobacterales bacterium]